MKRRALIEAIAALPLLGAASAGAHEVAEYKYHDTGSISRRDNYQMRLLALALDKTVRTHGPYRLTRVVHDATPRRLLQEMHEGRRINVLVAPALGHGVGTAPMPLLPVAVPILDKLLGYRSLIVRRDDLDRFKQVHTVNQLQRLRAGQGRDWIDTRILLHNGFRVDDSGNLEDLLPMLSNKRFDYVPVSIVEADSLLERHPDLADRLAIAPRLAISYPLPSVFYVSKQFPALAARLEQGLLTAKQDGSFERLFQSSFRGELRAIAAKGTRNFQVVNPFLQVP